MSRSKPNKPFGGKITTPPPGWLTTEEADTPASKESLLKLSDIHLPSRQPRHYFDPQALQGLADSIKQHGILQPLLVRPLKSGGYELVAGERRYRAATEVGLTEVPVVVKELTDEAAWQLALIENLQREDLNPVEETEGILQLLAIKLEIPVEDVPPLLHRLQKAQKNQATNLGNNLIGKATQDEMELGNNVIGKGTQDQTELGNNVIGKETQEETEPDNNVIGKGTQDKTESGNNVIGNNDKATQDEDNSQLAVIESVFSDLGLMTWESFVNNRLPLLNLPQDITEALQNGQIAYTKAKAIALLKDETQRTALLSEAIAHQLSLSQIKEKIRAIQTKPQSEVATIPNRLKVAYEKLKKTRIWEEPNKRKQIETLLSKLEALLKESDS